MIEPGRGMAYLALFSEIGLLLFTTTLGGCLLGYWIDQQTRTLPLFVVIGFFAGAGLGTFGIYRLITRFLARLDG